jgi:hypothetical protein
MAAAHPDVMSAESKHAADGDYAVDMMVVTLEPGGHTQDHSQKVRLLLVRAALPRRRGARPGSCCPPHAAAPLCPRATAAHAPCNELLNERRAPLPPLQDFGEHGREFISSELGLAFMRALTDPAALRKAAGGERRAARLRRILESCVFKAGGGGGTGDGEPRPQARAAAAAGFERPGCAPGASSQCGSSGSCGARSQLQGLPPGIEGLGPRGRSH